MNESNPSCSRFGVSHQCPICKSENLIKRGKTANGKQRYCCKNAINGLSSTTVTMLINQIPISKLFFYKRRLGNTQYGKGSKNIGNYNVKLFILSHLSIVF